jgi:hypothetical protein
MCSYRPPKQANIACWTLTTYVLFQANFGRCFIGFVTLLAQLRVLRGVRYMGRRRAGAKSPLERPRPLSPPPMPRPRKFALVGPARWRLTPHKSPVGRFDALARVLTPEIGKNPSRLS